jgi:PBSX family phage terminase large subunit
MPTATTRPRLSADLPLSPQQIRSIVEAQARINVWEGSVRSGKTIASLLRWLMYVADGPEGGDLIVAGKTFDTVTRNVFGPLQQRALFGAVSKQVHYTRGSSTASILGRPIEVITANDAKSEGRLRGMTAAGAYVDEATLIPEGYWRQLLARLSVPGAKLFATTNPDGPAHWLRKEFLLRAADLNLASWRFRLDDNPSLDPAYVASLKREYVGLWYRRFILGDWCLAEGAVYDMWDEARHVVDILPVITRWIALGIDYGTTNPFAALLLAVGVDRRLYLASEYRYDSKLARRQLTDSEYSERLRGWLADVPVPTTGLRGVRPEWTVVDPSAASFVTQLYRDGLTPTLANNAVLDRIRLTSSLLARDLLRVHRSCKGWRDEIPGYSWDPKKALAGEDAPIKADDHSLDGGGYAVLTTEAAWRPQLLEAA